MEVVHEIRKSAENKQQSPDHEINADRMLLTLCVRHVFPSPEIEDRKDEHPHQIDEVPIQAHDFDGLVVPLPAGEKAAPLVIVVSPPNFPGNEDREDHTDRDMRAVETRDHEEGDRKSTRLNSSH